MQENRLEMDARVSEEIKKRTEIKEKYAKLLAEKQFAGEVSNFIFEGSYSVSGRSPRVAYGTREVFTRYTTYFGVLEITKTANTYDLKWSINSSQKPQIHVGTGIKVGNILSAVFTESNDSPKGKWYGIVSYEVVNDEILRGVWTGIGDDVKAYEELRKLNLASA